MLLDGLELSPDHRKNLLTRGLSDQAIEAGLYRTLPENTHDVALRVFLQLAQTFDQIPGLLRRGGAVRVNSKPGLLIPVRDVAGLIVALKVRRDVVKDDESRYVYMSSRTRKNPGAPSPGSPAHVPAGISGPCNLVRITEGELKADVATQLSGIPTISFPGVSSWRSILPVLEKLQVRTVRLAFDADAATNPNVANALQDSSRKLRKIGYAVELERWSIDAGKGIDDLLISGGTPEVLVGDDAVAAVQGAEDTNDIPELTDSGNAKRLAAEYGDRIRFCGPWKSFLTYDGRRWQTDSNHMVKQYAMQIPSLIIKDIAKVGDRDYQESILKWAHRSQSSRAIRDMIYLIDALVPVDAAELDSHALLFNCANGTIDLETGELRKHDPTDYITRVSEIPYDPEAACPTWLNCIKTIVNHDDDLQDYLWRFFGYCLTGDTREHRLPIFHGDGSNGKSTILKTIMAVMGEDYSTKVARDLLTVQRHQSHPTGVCDLFGRRLAAAIETGEWERLDEPLIKELTGGDTVKARRLFENFWQFEPTHKIVICTNHKPRVVGRDHAIWRRIDLVPFDVQFWDPQKGESGRPEFRVDRSMDDRLIAERPGILAWLVRGCLAWQKDGLPQPEAVRVATEKFRNSQDDVPDFVRDCCVESADEMVPSDTLRKAYNDWKGGKNPLSSRSFKQKMEAAGYRCEKCKSGPHKDRMCWQGLGLQEKNQETNQAERREAETLPLSPIGKGVCREGTGKPSAILRSNCPDCSHPLVEAPTFDGFINTECSGCGRAFPARKDTP